MARYVSTPQVISGYANRCVFSTPGSYTFTVPDGVTSIKAITVGGGGNGSTGFVSDYTELSKPFKVSSVARNICSCYGSGCFNFQVCRCYAKEICSVIRANMEVCTDYPSVKNYSYAYTGAGGGYAEKTISVTPGDSFCVTVGDVEGTSSFFGTSGCLSATGASTPSECRLPSVGGYWDCIDDFTWTPLTNANCVCSDNDAQAVGNTNSYAYLNWGLNLVGDNDTFYWKEIFGCPLKCLVSTPGCGIGGDVNYTGGPSGQFNVTSSEVCTLGYGSTCYARCNGCTSNCIVSAMFTNTMGSAAARGECAIAWTCVYCALGTDIPAQQCGPYDNSTYPLSRNACQFSMCSVMCDNYNQFSNCCAGKVGSRTDPVVKTYSADRNFLNANKGGSSSGSPLGNGQEGGNGVTVFGAETDQFLCTATGLCTTSCCGRDPNCWYGPNPHFTCAECGYSTITALHCCHEYLLFHRYSDMHEEGASGCNQACKVYFSAGYDSLMNPCYYETCGWFVPKNAQCFLNRNRLDPTCGPCLACEPFNCKTFNIRINRCCNQSTGWICSLCGPFSKHVACPARYCCECNTGICAWFGNCTCIGTYNCCQGVFSDPSTAAICGKPIVAPGTTIEDVIDATWHPLTRNWYYCLCAYANDLDLVDECTNLAWKAGCRLLNHNMYYLGHSACQCQCTCSGQCNCFNDASWNWCHQYMTNCASQYFTNVWCNGFEGQALFCSPTKILNSITAADAYIVPGSAGGPNAKGNNGVVLGNCDIFIAGTGADPFGVTESQFIETSAGGGMPLPVYQQIRLNYFSDTFAWYLCECWTKQCTKYASGGTDPCNNCLYSLTDHLSCTRQCQCNIICSHLNGTGWCFASGNSDYCDYGVKLMQCYYAYMITNWGYAGALGEYGGVTTVCPCRSITVGSSGGIIISSKSKNFAGNPLCINTGGGGTTTTVAVGQGNYQLCINSCDCSCAKWGCVSQSNADWAWVCIDGNASCRYQVSHTNSTCPRLHSMVLGGESQMTKDCPALEINKISAGGSSDVFVNEQYTGGPLRDEYLYNSEDPVFGGTGQICIYGSSLYSLPGLTQGGSVGGCVVKGNTCQDVSQTPYSGGIFPKGTPGYGGGGTVCGSGGSGLVVVYWN